jgi:hypothetical protein
MNLIKLATWIFLLTILISSCEKSQDAVQNSDGFFSFTKTNGKTFTTTYVNSATPLKNGTFSLQYRKVGNSGSNWMFIIYIDNFNELIFNIETPTTIINWTNYTSSATNKVEFYGKLENVSLNVGRTNLLFEKSTIPGQIVGTFTAYDPMKTNIGSGKFNFAVK